MSWITDMIIRTIFIVIFIALASLAVYGLLGDLNAPAPHNDLMRAPDGGVLSR